MRATTTLPRNDSLWSRIPNPPPNLPDLNALAAKPAEATVPQGPRSVDDLMSELSKVYEEDQEDDEVYQSDALLNADAGSMPDLPMDRFAETVALMEDFNSNENAEANQKARQMAALHDIDDVLGISLSEVGNSESKSQDQPPARRERRRRNNKKKVDFAKAEKPSAKKTERSILQSPEPVKNDEASNERARTPSPQPQLIAGKPTSAGKASVGRSGGKVFDF